MNSRHRRARTSLLAITALWGATFSLNEVALHSITAPTLTFLRFALASVFLLVIFGRHRSFWRDLAQREVGAGVATGALLFGGYLTQTEGQRFISASLSGFLTGLSVILVPILLLLFHRRPSKLQIWAAILALAGLYLLAAPTGAGHLLGVALMLACAMFFAIQLVVVEFVINHVQVARFTLIQMVTVAVLAGLVTLVPGQGGLWPAHASGEAWLTVIINGIGASAVGFLAQTWSLRWLDSIEISIIYSMEPVFAALVALVALHQHQQLSGWIGGAIIVGAMLLISVGSRGDEQPGAQPGTQGPQESSF